MPLAVVVLGRGAGAVLPPSARRRAAARRHRRHRRRHARRATSRAGLAGERHHRAAAADPDRAVAGGERPRHPGLARAPPGTDDVERIRGVVRDLLFPCFFCAADHRARLRLAASPATMPAVQQFGALRRARRRSLSFAVGMTLVPVGLTFLTPPASPRAARTIAWLRRCSTGRRTRGDRPALARAARCFGAPDRRSAVAGLPLVRNNTDLVRFLKSDAPLFRDTMFIDAHLTGANTLEFVVTRRDGAPLTSADDLRRLAALRAGHRSRRRAGHRREQHPRRRAPGAARRERRRRAGAAARRRARSGYAFDLLEAAAIRT